MRTSWIVATWVLAACTSSNPRLCDETTRCADPTTPFCDRDAVFGEVRNSCLALACEHGEALACRDDLLYTCNATRDGYETSTCALGCGDQLQCSLLAPSNGLADYLARASSSPAITLGDGDELDVATGEVRRGGIVVQQLIGSSVASTDLITPPMRVYAASELRTSGDVRLTSSVQVKGPSIAFVVVGEVQIDGTLTLAASGRAGPPGSMEGGGLGSQNLSTAGGGGGGHATEGTYGGSVTVTNTSTYLPGGTRGPARPHETLEPLHGGGHGGRPDVSSSVVSFGGGAIQISSATRIRVSGFIDANAILPVVDRNQAAPGGGAGGAILLEAPVVEVLDGAALSANGVGGSSGDGFPASAPGRGNVSIHAACASESDYCTIGGDGGALDPPTEAGSIVTDLFVAFAGGGGGAAGYVRINTRSSRFARGPTAVISPPPLSGSVTLR